MRRLVRFGAGLGIAPEVSNADYASALKALAEKGNTPRRRASSPIAMPAMQSAALATMIARIRERFSLHGNIAR